MGVPSGGCGYLEPNFLPERVGLVQRVCAWVSPYHFLLDSGSCGGNRSNGSLRLCWLQWEDVKWHRGCADFGWGMCPWMWWWGGRLSGKMEGVVLKVAIWLVDPCSAMYVQTGWSIMARWSKRVGQGRMALGVSESSAQDEWSLMCVTLWPGIFGVEMGGATGERLNDSGTKGEMYDTLGKTRIQKTRDFLDQSFEESVVRLCEILHKLLQPKRAVMKGWWEYSRAQSINTYQRHRQGCISALLSATWTLQNVWMKYLVASSCFLFPTPKVTRFPFFGRFRPDLNHANLFASRSFSK